MNDEMQRNKTEQPLAIQMTHQSMVTGETCDQATTTVCTLVALVAFASVLARVTVIVTTVLARVVARVIAIAISSAVAGVIAIAISSAVASIVAIAISGAVAGVIVVATVTTVASQYVVGTLPGADINAVIHIVMLRHSHRDRGMIRICGHRAAPVETWRQTTRDWDDQVTIYSWRFHRLEKCESLYVSDSGILEVFERSAGRMAMTEGYAAFELRRRREVGDRSIGELAGD